VKWRQSHGVIAQCNSAPGMHDRSCHRRQPTKPPEEAVVIVAGYRLADLTRPDDGGSGVRRMGVVLGLEGRHDGRVELAAGRRGLGQALKSTSRSRRGRPPPPTASRYRLDWRKYGDPMGDQGEPARWGQ
jgi:hypothetical protein